MCACVDVTFGVAGGGGDATRVTLLRRLAESSFLFLSFFLRIVVLFRCDDKLRWLQMEVMNALRA
jgi:hypothetical protein